MNAKHSITKEKIRGELETARNDFHALIDSLSEQGFRKQSLNPGWTNGEILAHMTFGFTVVNVLLPLTRLWGRLPKASSKPFAWVLNSSTKPFNWFNALGARMQGKFFTYQRVEKIFDGVCFSLLKKVDSIQDGEWGHGMYYPTKWDSNFDQFMTLERLFHYPVTHFNFHRTQISPRE